MVTVSEKALNHVVELMMEKGITPDTHFLRVGVKGGGCSGLSYAMDFDDTITDMDEVVDLKVLKVIIDEKKERDCSLIFISHLFLLYYTYGTNNR
jgi:iron-sulfur cluster assembly protein